MFIAWSDSEQIEAWLARADPNEPSGASTGIGACSSRPVPSATRWESWSTVAAVAVAPITGSPALLDLDPAAEYSVGYLAASVFDERGQVALVINLDAFRSPLSAPEITNVGRRLLDTAMVITRATHGRVPTELQVRA